MESELTINGTLVRVDLGPGEEGIPLLALLHDRLGLTGAKYGCGEGECGACTVLVDGQVVRSCVTPVSSALGRNVLTIEGLEQDGELHPLQQAFLDNDAFQCGYCTPGMIMSALAFLSSCPNPRNDEIVAAMDGNICRCGTYRRIVRAVRQAAEELHPAVQLESVEPTAKTHEEAAS